VHRRRSHWKLDEAAGTSTLVADTPGVMARLGAGATLGGEGRAGRGLSLDGTASGYAATDLPAVSTSQSFTVAAWVRPTDTYAGHTVLAQDSVSQGGFQLILNRSRWTFRMPSGEAADPSWASVSTATAAVPDRWTHAAKLSLPPSQ
jgi:hypothetical protein